MKSKDTRIIWGLCFLFLMAAIAIYVFWMPQKKNATPELVKQSIVTENKTKSTAKKETENEKECAVYVSGAVKMPGLYRYQGNKRISDAIEAVGGFSQNAATDAINLAKPLTDGEQITVLTKKEVKKQRTATKEKTKTTETTESSSASGKININSASAEELMTLSGIGESKAKMIIDYRTQNGSFQKTEDIMKISGIKEGVYNKIKNDITI